MNVKVFDFDGTLISKNSFPLWIKYILRRTLQDLKLMTFFWFLWLLMLRKLRLLSHSRFKFLLLKVKYPEIYDRDFVGSLVQYFNLDIVDRVVLCGGKSVLSSAAPERYLQYVQGVMGMRFLRVLGSKIVGEKYSENFSENKVLSLRDNLPSVVCEEFYSDHHEDLPLMRFSKSVVLVRPSLKTIKMVNQAGVAFAEL